METTTAPVEDTIEVGSRVRVIDSMYFSVRPGRLGTVTRIIHHEGKAGDVYDVRPDNVYFPRPSELAFYRKELEVIK